MITLIAHLRKRRGTIMKTAIMGRDEPPFLYILQPTIDLTGSIVGG